MDCELYHVKIKTTSLEAEGIMSANLFRAFMSAVCPKKIVSMQIKHLTSEEREEVRDDEDSPF